MKIKYILKLYQRFSKGKFPLENLWLYCIYIYIYIFIIILNLKYYEINIINITNINENRSQ